MKKILIFLSTAPSLEIDESDFGKSSVQEITDKIEDAINRQSCFRLGNYGLNGKYIVGFEVTHEKDSHSVSQR